MVEEDDDDEENDVVASDLALIRSEDDEIVLAIGWTGGRVDLGVIVDPPVPRWLTSRVS